MKKIVSFVLVMLLVSIYAVSAMAETAVPLGIVTRSCGANGCTSVTFREYCSAREEHRSDTTEHTALNGTKCSWFYLYCYTNIKCTKCGNSFADYGKHLHSEKHYSTCRGNVILCPY